MTQEQRDLITEYITELHKFLKARFLKMNESRKRKMRGNQNARKRETAVKKLVNK